MQTRTANLLLAVLLVAGTFTLYARVGRFEFVNYDDPAYTYENPHVLQGFTWNSFRWSLTTSTMGHWCPLVWMSYMLDVELFGGMHAGAEHWMNVAQHAASAALLFWALLTMTKQRWPSFFAAAAFAWHPLHVESVAWITERKDTLSTLFWMLCMLAYAQYAQAPTRRRYTMVIVWLALGLTAKSMLVTLPFVFLLLDYLPLNRLGSVPVKKIILEKLPMMPLILGASIAAYWAQHVEHVIEQMPPSMHLKNAIVSCAVYLRQTFVPVKLAVFYPHVATLHRDLGVGAVALSGTVIILISVVALLRARREPGLLVGWLWYLGTLVPVIGLVQAGAHAHADRYTYVPLIGVFIAIAWLGAEWAKKWAKVVCAAAVISLAAMCAMTWHQLGYWRNTRTLMQHAIEVVPDNYVAYSNLGEACDAIGEHDNAAELYHKVLALNPDDPLALNNLAVQAVARGDEETAMKLYPRAISSDRTYAPAYNNYGNLLVRRGKLEQAIRVYRAGIKQDREFAPIRHNLALALAQIGRLDEAIDLWRTALEMNPAYADAHESLGNALVLRGQTREGIAELKDALRLQPDRVGALKSLAWIYATHPSPLFQNATEARKLAARAVELKPDDAVAQDTLAAAYARGGRFDEAIDAEERAASLAESQQLQDLVPQIQKRLELYRSHHPFTSGR